MASLQGQGIVLARAALATLQLVGICIEYAKHKRGIRMEYVWNMCGTCMDGIRMEQEWHMYGICMEYSWNMNGIYVMDGIRMEEVCRMYEICMEYVWSL